MAHPVTIDGKVFPTLGAAAEAMGITPDCLSYRLKKIGSRDIARFELLVVQNQYRGSGRCRGRPRRNIMPEYPPEVRPEAAPNLPWKFVHRLVKSSQAAAPRHSP